MQIAPCLHRELVFPLAPSFSWPLCTVCWRSHHQEAMHLSQSVLHLFIYGLKHRAGQDHPVLTHMGKKLAKLAYYLKNRAACLDYHRLTHTEP